MEAPFLNLKYPPLPLVSGDRAAQRDQAGSRVRVVAAADAADGARPDLLPGRLGQPQEVAEDGRGRDGGARRRRQGPGATFNPIMMNFM